MTKLGRRHRPFFRLCAVDGRAARDGKVIEYLGHYDPMVNETDARAVLNKERIDYWLSVGAQPSEKVAVLIKKYGSDGTHLEQQSAAIQRLKVAKPMAPPPQKIPRKAEETPAEEGSAATATASEETAAADPTPEPAAETAPADAAPADAAPADTAAAETSEGPGDSAADADADADAGKDAGKAEESK